MDKEIPARAVPARGAAARAERRLDRVAIVQGAERQHERFLAVAASVAPSAAEALQAAVARLGAEPKLAECRPDARQRQPVRGARVSVRVGVPAVPHTAGDRAQQLERPAVAVAGAEAAARLPDTDGPVGSAQAPAVRHDRRVPVRVALLRHHDDNDDDRGH